MRNAFDFTPYRRSSIGFDGLFDLLENAARTTEPSDGYPPFDLEQVDDDSYRINIAVAGFNRDDLDITSKPNLLVVSGRKRDSGDRKFIHRGIAARAFERQFQLGDYVVVTGATLNDGLLEVELRREVPDAVKPRRIEIGGAQPSELRIADNDAVENDGERDAA